MKKNLLTLIVLSIISCFSISTVWAQTNCDGLDGGVPVGPDPAVFVLGETAAADIAATSIPDAGTTDYTFVVTTPFGTAVDADGNPVQAVDENDVPIVDANGDPVYVEGEFIVGITDDGSFNFSDDGTGTAFQVGVYNFTGFGFNQAELDAIGGLINGPLWGTVAGFLELTPEEADQVQALVPESPNLAELLLLLDALSDVPQTIASVLATIDIIIEQAAGLLSVCYAVSEAPYTVSVEEPAAACSIGTTSVMMSDSATGSGTADDPYVICAQESFTLMSDGDFEAPAEFPNPNVVWLIYTCTPTSTNPFEDDCAALLSLVDENGVIYGSGEASLFGQELGTYQVCPTIVPNEPELTIDPSCTGIIAGEACTTITILDAFGEACLCSDPENIPNNDACVDNVTIDVMDGAINGPFGNLCATVDETTDELPVIFFDESLENTVWFTFMGDGCTYHIYTSSDCGDINLVDEGAYITDGDTQMAVFTGEGCENLTLVASNEDDTDFGSAAGDYFSGVVLETMEGMEYSVMIDGYAGSFGFFCMNADLIECPVDPIDPPANDACDAAFTLEVANGTQNGPFTNVAATGDDGDVPACFGDSLPDGTNTYDNSVWFTFEGTGEIITLTTSNGCVEVDSLRNIDTQLAVFDACGGAELACNDDIDLDGENYMSSVTVETMVGMTYTVVVDGYFYNTIDDGYEGEFCIDVVAEAAVACDANFGTVMAPANTAICAGEMSEAVMVMDAAGEGYTSLFVVTEGADLVIVGLQETGEFDAATYSDTETFYTVHAFNFADGDTEAILATVELGVTTGGAVAGLIADGVICASLDVAGTVFTTLAADDPACNAGDPCDDNPIMIATDIDCDGQTGEFFVTVTISGGFPSDEEGYTITGTITNANTVQLGNPFTIGPLSDGGTFQVGATDLAGCSTNFQSDPVACTKCPEVELGDMPADAQYACDGAAVAAVLSGFTITDSIALVYAVHTSATDAAGTILAANDNGTFMFSDLDGGEYYTTYYISAVAGIDADNDGAIDDLGNECTTVVPGTPIMFFAPVMLTQNNSICDGDTGEGSGTFSVTGGYPASSEGMANAATYAISGYTSAAVMAGEEFAISGLTNGSSWTVVATDNFCGEQSELSGISECIKTPVEWLSFTGETQNDGNFLKWVTATETQSHYFAVESSVDGTNFQVIGTEEAAGESSTTIAYEFLDRDALAGTTYYRITQYDFDGSYSQTDVLALTRGEVTFGIGSLQPVPANNTLTVRADFATATKADIVVYTLNGKVVSTTQVEVTEGANSINLDVANIAAGMYFITVSNGVETATDKFVKQ
ncbi:MAG: T9SS type A sorting domain-containing protein [Chitinophagales bacterium]